MKKKIRNIISVFLCCTLVILFFTGCDTTLSDEVSSSILSNDLNESDNKLSDKISSAESSNDEKENDIEQGVGITVHFIDVGQADAALILCDGKAMMIDGGNSEDSNLIYSYLKKQSIEYLDYVICTHAHEDHVGGLSGALNRANIGIAYSPVTDYSSNAFKNFVNNVAKQGKSITIPKVGTNFKLGEADVKIIAPIKEYEDTNNTSIVLRITYGIISFLFTGDAEYDSEKDILESGAEIKSTVLKVGHHGSESSTCYSFLREVNPEYAVISVGKGNSYGHPTENVLSRLRDADIKLFRTDMQGDIICHSDGKTVSFITAKNQNIQTNETAPDTTTKIEEATSTLQYIGNKNSKKFHLSSCNSVPAEKNRVYFDSREKALNNGYEPCKRCNP